MSEVKLAAHASAVNVWMVPRRCSATHCVEVRIRRDGVDIRESAGDGEPTIFLTHDEWRRFTEVVKGRQAHSPAKVKRDASGKITIRRGDTTLRFTNEEWAAFVTGLIEGDFDLAA